jgi:hypothetical protein
LGGGGSGAVVVLLACPSPAYIPSLASSRLWGAPPPPPTKGPVAQGASEGKGEREGEGEGRGAGGGGLEAELVVHFGGREVLCDCCIRFRMLLLTCPHAAAYVSACCYRVSGRSRCMRRSRGATCVSACYYICVRILRRMCPHTATCVSAYCCCYICWVCVCA